MDGQSAAEERAVVVIAQGYPLPRRTADKLLETIDRLTGAPS